ncbi:hypothetical protein NDN08_005979 [Rhodosorus marinus]|uniref:Acyl carrier protein n=1 Tax=Rhodosorus marinus TaxID=101924 RepID=A0AAV8UJH6_9RHOD|nr:hypothetical protein NDN08_005979 [Rhodosorus marinus]
MNGMKTLTMGSLNGKSRPRRYEVMIQKRWGGGDIGWVDEHGNEFYMNPLEAEERVINVIKWFEKIKVPQDKITKDMTFEDLGLDSLDNVELLLAIEEEFDMEMTDAQADKITSIQETIDFLINHPFVVQTPH